MEQGTRQEAPKEGNQGSEAKAAGNEPAQEQAKQEQPKAQGQPREQKRGSDNVIFVGKKPTMSYVLAVVTQFSDGAREVLVKARGRSISHAVDIAEVVRNRFVHDAKPSVDIGTEEVTDRDGRKLKVSTISIALRK